MFCCNTLFNLTKEMGRPGLSVIGVELDDVSYFALQARICDAADEEKLKTIPPDLDLPRSLKIASEIAIKFCPFCGASLEKAAMNNRQEFEKLVENSRKYAL